MTVTQIWKSSIHPYVLYLGTNGLVNKKMALIHVQLLFWSEHLSTSIHLYFILYVYM